jgi:hypothetical protein
MQNPNDNIDEEMTAYHEAGNAVIGYRLGFTITRVTIK